MIMKRDAINLKSLFYFLMSRPLNSFPHPTPQAHVDLTISVLHELVILTSEEKNPQTKQIALV